MSAWRRCRRGRRAVGLIWLGSLVLSVLAAASAPAPRLARAQQPPPPAVPRDTTGQAELRRQVPRPQRAASLFWADRSIYRVRDGEAVTYHYGNVYLDRDTLVVRADSAQDYRDRGVVRLFDNVRIRRHATRIASDWAEYRQGPGEADLRGRVRVVEALAVASARRGEMREDMQLLRLIEDALLVTPDYTVAADTLVRDQRQTHGEAYGRVRIVDPDSTTVATGDRGIFAYDGSWAEVDRDPGLVTRDGDSEPVRSWARLIRFHRDDDRVVLVDTVRIVQGRMRAYADTAIAFGRERMLLRGRPRLEDGDRNRMYGEEIEFFYRDGRLDRVVMVGQARMEDSEPDSLAGVHRGLPALDVLEGDSITVHFHEGAIHRTDVVGNAHSVFVPLDLEDEVAFNEVRGDTLVLRFQDERVRQVEVRGNMVGSYHFARLERMGALRGLAAGDAAAAAAAVDSLVRAAGDSQAMAAVDSLVRAAVDSLALAAVDSLPVGAAAALADTLDFALAAERVDYSGHGLLFDMAGRTIAVSQEAKLAYGTMTLVARDIVLDTETRELYADGDPILEDGEIIVGAQMGYDFANRTGAVRQGVTTMDGYFYVGDQVNRYPDGSLKICSGRMTSCDLEHPHYHFWGDRMKIRMNDRVVAAPIVLKVGRVPIFALPFYFKSLKEGRRSGILFPNFNFGWSSREGRYIRDLGYYWAASDYMDFTFEIDYNERRELAWRVRNQYAKRYAFSGAVDYNALRGLRSGEDLREWQLRWNHDQPTLFDDYRFRADVEMASRELSRSNLDQDRGRDVISGQLSSNVYVSRSFGFGGASLNASRTEFTNARDDDPTTDKAVFNMTLPSLSLSVKQWTLGKQLRGGQKGSILGDLGRNTYFTQGYSFSNQQSETEETRSGRQSANGNWGLTLRPPRLSIFNWTVGASSSWNWTRTDQEGRLYSRTDSTWTDFARVTDLSRPSLSLTSSVSTALYGTFPVKLGALEAIRHTLRLNGGVSYRPQLGSKQDRGSSYSLSANNRFDVKYLTRGDRDTTRTVRKLDGLLDWSLNTSYNPDALRPWSDIGSGLTLKPGQSRNLSFKLNNTIDPYLWKITRTQFNYSFGFNGRIDTGHRGQARQEQADERYERLGDGDAADQPPPTDADWQAGGDQDDPFAGQDGFFGGHFDVIATGGGQAARDETEGGRYIPFNLSGSLSVIHTAASEATTARVNISGGARLTRDWEFRYTTQVDLETGRLSRQEYRLQRDLHCWRLEFMRAVSPQDSQFGFRFYLKAIPELKVTRGKEDMLGSAAGLGALF